MLVKEKGIAVVVDDMCPGVEYSECMRHLSKNIVNFCGVLL